MVAAFREGLDFIGFEKDKKWFELADERIRTEQAQMTIFDFIGRGEDV